MEIIIEGLLPVHGYKNTTIWPTGENPNLVTDIELRQAARSLKTNKTPGIDGEPNEILKKTSI